MSDIWPEINKETTTADKKSMLFFEDHFRVSSEISQTDQLPDTKEYLRCLERKLKRLKDSSKVSSEDIIQSLIDVKQDTMRNFLASNKEDEPVENLSEIDETGLKEDQRLLIKSDYLALRIEQETAQNSI